MKNRCLGGLLAVMALFPTAGWADTGKEPVDYVNPFVGTTNYGTTNPGALCPQGMMSVVPFNVMGGGEGNRDKDKTWTRLGGPRHTSIKIRTSPAMRTSTSAEWDVPNWVRSC